MSEPLNDTINRQLQHRTIRYFTDEALSQETLTQLVAVAQHTATSHYLQSFSVLSITDRHLRGQIAAIAKQPYINQNGHLFIFVADQHRAAVIAKQAGVSQTHLGSTDKFIQAVSDAVLAAQNVVNAAESLGLGTVLLGSILNDPRQLISLLGLPQLTFPVLGLIVGHPAQTPQAKPRLPEAAVHFENRYALPEPLALADYDQVIHNYYATRDTNRREETFTARIARFAQVLPEKRGELQAAIREQGFLAD